MWMRLVLGAMVAMLLGVTGVRAETVRFTAADGVVVEADLGNGADPGRPLILLFHQAGSNRGEYDPIAEKLHGLGFATLAVDARSGGRRWGRDNATVAAAGGSSGFLEALPDLKAALDWSAERGFTGPVLAWGSSYSAALVFLLAADRPQDVDGILAFSPGEYLDAPDMVRMAARRVTVPVFATSSDDRGEVDAARTILAAVPGDAKVHHVPRQRVHGSSTLRDDQNRGGAAENWEAVTGFLARWR